VNDGILKDLTELIWYRVSFYFARLPFRKIESGSLTQWPHFLSLPSTLPLPATPLRFGLSSPYQENACVTRLGLPSHAGQQKKTRRHRVFGFSFSLKKSVTDSMGF
jgi:hypothetical protein